MADPDTGWSGDNETRPVGEGSSGTHRSKPRIFTDMATTQLPKPVTRWTGEGETRPGDVLTSTDVPTAQPTSMPSTGTIGRTTRITALMSAGGRRGPLSGAVWPDYELGDLLGQGGMGAVYRARQISVDRLVALKVLPAHLANDADLRRRFEIEARASSTLASPHIVQVYHAGIHDNQLYFAMEFVAGQSLAELAKARRAAGTWFALTETLGYVAQLTEALRVAGAAGVVHRDIKPANCMVDAEGQLKLADFGLAKILGEDGGTLTGTAMGTPSYLSPEQARGGEEIDQRADLYSLGILLYELACGRLPYTGGSPDALIYQHAFTEPPLPRSLNKDISADLQAVILKLIQKDPAVRYADARALLTDLGRITGGMAPEVAVFVGRKLGTGADAALARIGGWRRRAWIAAAAVIASAGVLGAGWWWHDVRKTEEQQLRGTLVLLDQHQPVPDGAAAALVRLASVVGERDRDVVRWRETLQRIQGLEGELKRLASSDRLDIPGAETVLAALEREIGSDSPLARQQRERLAAAHLDLAALRRELAALDQVDTAPAALTTTMQPRLERFLRLAPPGDADGVRWGLAIERSATAIAGLRQRLAVLDGPRQAPTDLPALGNDLARLRELAGAEDVAAERLRRRLGEAEARVAAWRASLARLAGSEPPDAVTVAATAGDLAAWAEAAGEDDPELRRWRAAVAASAAQRQRLAGELTGLGETTIPAARLPATDATITAYRRLAGLDDADGQRWAEQVTAARDRLEVWRHELATLDAKPQLTREDQELARAALTGLRSVAALDQEVDERWRQRLARDAARIETLRSGLAILDQVASPPAGAAKDLDEYGRLVGADDTKAIAWRTRLAQISALRDRLGTLGKQLPLPADAKKDLATLSGLIGSGDPQLTLWRGKFERCDVLVRELADLDRAQPPRDDASARLDAYQREVGPDAPDLRRWRAKLERITVLRKRLDGLDARLLPDPGATEACAALALLIDAEAVAPKLRRLAELAGPSRPAWAVEDGKDAAGRWAAVDLDGLRLRLRWIPCGTVRLGCPPTEEAGREADEAPVLVTLTRGFWLAERECSQAAWRALMGTSPALHHGDDLPVERVSWDQAGAWCAALATRLGTAVRLPSEAEWEHAARAGFPAAIWIGPQGAISASEIARVAVHAADAPLPTGSRLPNPLGLFDLQGSVWEWCQDGYAPYPVRPATDHLGSGPLKVIRGGSWGDGPADLCLANRHRVEASMRSPYLGFRVVVEGGSLVPIALPATARTYVVRAGDTLTRIAERELGSKERWREIVDLNPGLGVKIPLRVGQKLQIGVKP